MAERQDKALGRARQSRASEILRAKLILAAAPIYRIAQDAIAARRLARKKEKPET